MGIRRRRFVFFRLTTCMPACRNCKCTTYSCCQLVVPTTCYLLRVADATFVFSSCAYAVSQRFFFSIGGLELANKGSLHSKKKLWNTSFYIYHATQTLRRVFESDPGLESSASYQHPTPGVGVDVQFRRDSPVAELEQINLRGCTCQCRYKGF